MTSEHLSELVLSFDSAVFRLNAIKKAGYRFGDRCFVQITSTNDHEVTVGLQCRQSDIDLDQLAGEFRNEVLDQELRELVAEETTGVRNLLMAQAFSATSLVDPEGETADFEADPLHIQVSDKP